MVRYAVHFTDALAADSFEKGKESVFVEP